MLKAKKRKRAGLKPKRFLKELSVKHTPAEQDSERSAKRAAKIQAGACSKHKLLA